MSNNEKNASCCGGHEHGHNHADNCCDGHGHNHAHGESCCGGHTEMRSVTLKLTETHIAILNALAITPFLPLGQFVMQSSKSSHFESVALSPVYLMSHMDNMETIKATGRVLSEMEKFGLISLDYEIPLEDYSYEEYYNCSVFSDFKDMMKEASEKEDFVFDTPHLEQGSIALTEQGQSVIDRIDDM